MIPLAKEVPAERIPSIRLASSGFVKYNKVD